MLQPLLSPSMTNVAPGGDSDRAHAMQKKKSEFFVMVADNAIRTLFETPCGNQSCTRQTRHTTYGAISSVNERCVVIRRFG
jgi:hypothetical protein